MKVGLGTTVLSKGNASGHIDGIGLYTKHLLEHLPLLELKLHTLSLVRSN